MSPLYSEGVEHHGWPGAHVQGPLSGHHRPHPTPRDQVARTHLLPGRHHQDVVTGHVGALLQVRDSVKTGGINIRDIEEAV